MKKLLFVAYSVFVLLVGFSLASMAGGGIAPADSSYSGRANAFGVSAGLSIRSAKEVEIMVYQPGVISSITHSKNIAHIYLK
ncbi:MAG: hypothetical protein H0S85_10875 [Desulfovibrionaceae bacterium]|nr:hypothetical protein [Desulfovibrionaceae bacterium]